MEGDLEHATQPAIRIVLTALAVLVFVLAALLDERPQLMLVGLAPLALIAGEAVWHLLGLASRRRVRGRAEP